MDYTVTVPGGGTVDVWLPVPVSDAFQTISALRIVSPGGHRMDGGDNGNRFAYVRMKGEGRIPVDASEAAKDPVRRRYFFGAHDENRVEFSRGRDVMLAPRQKGERLNFFVDAYAEESGRKRDGVSTTVSCRDEPGA